MAKAYTLPCGFKGALTKLRRSFDVNLFVRFSASHFDNSMLQYYAASNMYHVNCFLVFQIRPIAPKLTNHSPYSMIKCKECCDDSPLLRYPLLLWTRCGRSKRMTAYRYVALIETLIVLSLSESGTYPINYAII